MTAQLPISPKAKLILKNGPVDGITLGFHSKDFHYDYENSIKEIHQTGSKWIGFTIKFFQDFVDSDSIKMHPANHPYWLQIKRSIQQSKALGLQVMIFPIVLIEQPKGKQWRGVIRPKDKTSWYQSYGKILTRLSTLCQDHQVELLSVGSELTSMQTDSLAWSTLIKQCRKNYDGALTYSANWDAVRAVKFHPHLDLLGMTTYFSLSLKNDPSLRELTRSWQRLKNKILHFQKIKNIPIILTEVGYASINGINKHPWNYHISKTVDLKEQDDCYRAFIKVWKKESNRFGAFFYDWFGLGGIHDKGYTFRGKPAYSTILKWFDKNYNPKQ